MKKLLRNLSFWVFAAMILGILVGYLMGPSAHVLAPLGTLFMQLIQMLVVPLVFISIVSGAATLGGSRSAGRIGVTSIGYILVTTLISTVLAILIGSWLAPGSGLDASSIDLLASQNTTDMSAPPSLTFWGTIIGMIPANPVRALTEGNILQIIVFGLFLGFGISTLAAGKKEPVIRGVNYLLEALIWCINKVMLVAPLGVFGLMADATGTFGFDILLSVANLLWVDIIVVLAMGLGIYPLTIALFSRTPVTHFFRSMAEPQIVAFSTSSSMATLPVNMETVEKKLGVSKQVTSFVIPLGATINMTGNAIYYTLVALFFAQLYGIDLNLGHYIAISITASLPHAHGGSGTGFGRDSPLGSSPALCPGPDLRHDPHRAQHHGRCRLRRSYRLLVRQIPTRCRPANTRSGINRACGQAKSRKAQNAPSGFLLARTHRGTPTKNFPALSSPKTWPPTCHYARHFLPLLQEVRENRTPGL